MWRRQRSDVIQGTVPDFGLYRGRSREAMYIQGNIETPSRNLRCRAKAKSIKYLSVFL